MNIGTQLQQQRKKLNYTQEEIAEKIHVSRQTISSWENSKSLPDIMSVILLSDIYDLSLDDLLKGDRKMIEKIEAEENLKKASKWISWTTIGTSAIVIVLTFIFNLSNSLNLNIESLITVLAMILGILNLITITVFNNYKSKVGGKEGKDFPIIKVILFTLGIVVASLCIGLCICFALFYFFLK